MPPDKKKLIIIKAIFCTESLKIAAHQEYCVYLEYSVYVCSLFAFSFYFNNQKIWINEYEINAKFANVSVDCQKTSWFIIASFFHDTHQHKCKSQKSEKKRNQNSTVSVCMSTYSISIFKSMVTGKMKISPISIPKGEKTNFKHNWTPKASFRMS